MVPGRTAGHKAPIRRAGEVVAAGEAVVPSGRDVSVSVRLSATLDAEAVYGLLVAYGDGVAAYRLLDPDPAGQGGFPYTAGGGMVRVLGDGQTSYFFDSSTGCSVISSGGVSC